METGGAAGFGMEGSRGPEPSRPGFVMDGESAARYFEAVVRQSAVAIVVTDLDHIIRVWSAGAERLLGYRAEAVVGEPHAILIPSERLETDERDLRQRLIETDQVLFHATERLAKDGRRIPVEVCRSVVRDRDGTAMGYSSVILDLTEKLAMQDRLLQAERTTALARVVGKVFHELRTPLGVLVLQSEILSEEIDALLDLAGEAVDPAVARRLRESLEVFTREIQRIEGLAEDYLLMIRPIRAHPSTLRLGDFLETVRSELTSKIRHPEGEVRVECPLPDTTVSLDPLQMLRVFHNLAGNSLDAIPEGKAPALVVRAAVEQGSLVLRLKDNGPGLPADLLGGGAFEIFATTKRSGSGLGLHLVQEIVTAHEGSISLSNLPEGGAEAVVRLPMRGPARNA